MGLVFVERGRFFDGPRLEALPRRVCVSEGERAPAGAAHPRCVRARREVGGDEDGGRVGVKEGPQLLSQGSNRLAADLQLVAQSARK